MINNFGTGFTGPLSGFTIDFTGSTCVFNQPPPPKMQQILPYCDLSSHVTIQTNTQVLCSSLAADGSDFYLTPGGTIASVEGLNCTGASGYTNQIKINFSSPLPNGDYSIHAKVGSDGNTLLGLCNSALALPDSLNFHVGLDPIAMISIDSPACQLLKINLNTPAACNTIAPDGSDFSITGPSNVAVASATGANCVPGGFTSTVELSLSQPIAVDGTYHIHAQIGSDGNSLMDSCGRILPPQSDIPFVVNSFNGLLKAKPDTTICNIGGYVTLYEVNNGPPPASGFNYQWLPATNVQYPNDAVTPLLVGSFRNYYVLETVDANGCYLRDSVTVLVKPFTATLSPVKAEGCIGDPIPLYAGAGTNYSWYDNASLTSVPTSTLDCTNCPDPKATPPLGQKDYYVLVTNALGCKDTLKATLTVHDKPVIEALPADTTIKYGSSVVLHAFGGTFYSWSPTSSLNDSYLPSPIATPKDPTTYVVTGANEFGCMSTDTSIVNIDYRDGTMIPNAFSPNGDGLNDVFKIQNIHFRKLLAFQVFDRWGNKIFETTDPNVGWDGNYKGKPVTMDVYYYYIKLGYEDETVETFKGDVTLLR
jgi:gliding motility-associated-like protein